MRPSMHHLVLAFHSGFRFFITTLVSKRLEGVSIDTVSDVLDEYLQQTEMALVEGGTMVGTIAAQSVGEPATQMSASYDTDVIVEVDGEVKRVPIGPLVDSILNSPETNNLVRTQADTVG